MHPRFIISRRLRRHQRLAAARVACPRMHGDALAAYQLNALRTAWADAVADVPYYEELARSGAAPSQIVSWDDFHRVPVLTRQILQDRPAMFVRRSGPAEAVAKTAGSTGTPIHVGMNQAERDVMRTVKLAAWQELGYREDDRLFIMWGHIHLLGSGLTRAINHARRTVADAVLGYRRVDAYRLNPELCAIFARQLIDFRPVGFIGYASALDLFARYTQHLRPQFHELGMKFVLATSEPPPRPDTLSLLRDTFGCPVVQEYGGVEFGQVAFKHADEPFKVYGDLNHVEAETSDSDASPVLISSLYRRYVPLIRYRVGDAVVSARRDASGHVREFAGLAGRVNDEIVLDGGDAIHSLSILHALQDEAAIYNVQMLLRDSGVVFNLVAPAADRAAVIARVRPRLARLHPALASAEFQFVDDVDTTRAGKRRWYLDQRTHPSCAASPVS